MAAGDTAGYAARFGDRTAGDLPEYRRDDLKLTPTPAGGWLVTRKDGSPY
jgi:hypothetical protein